MNEATLLTYGQYSLVYNAFSFTFATMAAATLFLWLGRSTVAPPYRTALVISGLVCAIAAYHYLRIFQSWEAAFDPTSIDPSTGIISASGLAFNDAYRYVDWLLTVPLLLIELILVMRLSSSETMSKSIKLGAAAALMIVLGYPGEVAESNGVRALWGFLSTIPFLYIVYELFVGLGESIERQPDSVKGLIKTARLVTFASWGFYPIVYMAPFVFDTNSGSAEVILQVGYTIADIVAKAGIGVLIYVIARRKSEVEYGTDYETAPVPDGAAVGRSPSSTPAE